MINENPDYYKRVKLQGNRTAFMFDSSLDYNKFIAQTIANMESGNNCLRGVNEINEQYAQSIINRKGESWFGTTDSSNVVGELNTYLYNDELDRFLGDMKSRTLNVDVIDIDQNKQIKFTEQELGIFSFDLASLGLIRVYEFYSPLLKRIVNPDNVVSETENGQTIYYHVYKPAIERHKVEYNASVAGFYSSILGRAVKKDEIEEVIDKVPKFYFIAQPEIKKHEVQRSQKLDEKGNRKFATTFKKSFIYIPKVDKPMPRIDLIVGSSFNADVRANDQMLYASMAAITVAEKLSKSGIDYRIIACYPAETSGRRGYKTFPFVTIKKEGQTFDRNNMALLLSDGRQFRYNQFKGFLSTFYDAGYSASVDPDSIGYAIYEPNEIKNAYMDYLKTSTNPSDIIAAKNPNSKIVFSGALSLNEAVNQYNTIVSQISNLTT